MAIFTTLKKAFGFGGSEMDEEELEGIDARVIPLRGRLSDADAPAPMIESENMAADNADEQSNVDDDSAEQSVLPSAIFESVVKIFNESLPDFIKHAVDEKAQCDYIYQSLDASMKRYIEDLDMDARRRCTQKWENERKSMQMQMETLRKKSQKDEEDSSDSKKLQLSAERQKRALSERVHDLEKQLASMEAENEQYMLENKTLVNKLRLTTVMGGESSGREESEAVAAKVVELSDALDAARTECGNKDKEIADLRTALEQSRAKDDIGDAMLTDLNKKLAEALEKVASQATEISESNAMVEAVKQENEAILNELNAAKQLTELAIGEQDELKSKLDETLSANASLKSEISNLKIEHGATEDKLREALENLEVVEDMQRQLSSLEESRVANEAFLRRQKDEILQKDELIRQGSLEKEEYAAALKKKEETIRSLEELTDSLRKTIEDNLYEHAQSQSVLRLEIERLKGRGMEMYPEVVPGSGLASEPQEDSVASAVASRKPRSKKKLKISAIDETLEDTDWLVATPPPTKKKVASEDESAEFGYREPSKKSTPDNPAQMSLW